MTATETWANRGPATRPTTWSTAIPPYGLTPGGGGEAPGYYGGLRLANWGQRALAGLIDLIVTVVLPGELLDWLISDTVRRPLPDFPDYIVEQPNPWNDRIAVIVLVLFLLNTVFMQGRTGQSLGKLIVGVQLTRAEPHGSAVAFSYPGVPLCLARLLAHFVDILSLGIGFLRPAWHPQRRTFADSLMKTVVLAEPARLAPAQSW